MDGFFNILLGQVIAPMAFNAMPRRTSRLAQRGFVCMATTAKVVKLALKQRPHLLVGRVTVHARTATGIVVVIMVA